MIKLANTAWVLIFATIFFSCGGSLTPEQREKALKAIEEGKIKRITPAQLMEAALQKGKKVVKDIGGKDSFFNDALLIDSIASENEVIIYSLKPGMTGLSKAESDIADAYQSQGDVSGVGDNIQKLSGDTLLYTQPVGQERPDGSRPFSYAIAVKMAVKQIVSSIPE
jgi:hypothetical protein